MSGRPFAVAAGVLLAVTLGGHGLASQQRVIRSPQTAPRRAP
ncbi:MAG TPA: hypothetical protein VL263_10950 [Vicinamibacterales bacterium]|nr:hypothetical protein [Vicinamibacterales bacterium]